MKTIDILIKIVKISFGVIDLTIMTFYKTANGKVTTALFSCGLRKLLKQILVTR